MKNINQTICAIRMCSDGKNIWFFHAFLNILYRFNMLDHTLKAYMIPHKSGVGIYLYSDIHYRDNKIWLIPGKEKQIVIFHTENETFECVDIENIKYGHTDNEWNIYAIDSMIFNEWIYLFPHVDSIIQRWNIGTKRLENVIDLADIEDVAWLGGNVIATLSEEECLLSRLGSSNLAKFQLSTAKIEVLNTDLQRANEISLLYSNNRLYIRTNSYSDPYVYELDLHTGKIINKIETKAGYASLNSLNGRFIVLDYADFDEYVVITPDLKKVKSNCYNSKCDNSYSYYCGKMGVWLNTDSNTTYCLNNIGNEMIQYVGDDIEIKQVIPLETDDLLLEEAIKIINATVSKSNGIVIEGQVPGYEFSDYIESITHTPCKAESLQQLVGRKIYHSILGDD